MPEYFLTYFDIFGRAEPMRMALAHAGADWDERRVTGAEWVALKPTIKSGSMPILDLSDGSQLSESLAILRYICANNGYIPEDNMDAYWVDCIAEKYKGVI
jgi:glutathione S-transferase